MKEDVFCCQWPVLFKHCTKRKNYAPCLWQIKKRKRRKCGKGYEVGLKRYTNGLKNKANTEDAKLGLLSVNKGFLYGEENKRSRSPFCVIFNKKWNIQADQGIPVIHSMSLFIHEMHDEVFMTFHSWTVELSREESVFGFGKASLATFYRTLQLGSSEQAQVSGREVLFGWKSRSSQLMHQREPKPSWVHFGCQL